MKTTLKVVTVLIAHYVTKCVGTQEPIRGTDTIELNGYTLTLRSAHLMENDACVVNISADKYLKLTGRVKPGNPTVCKIEKLPVHNGRTGRLSFEVSIEVPGFCRIPFCCFGSSVIYRYNAPPSEIQPRFQMLSFKRRAEILLRSMVKLILSDIENSCRNKRRSVNVPFNITDKVIRRVRKMMVKTKRDEREFQDAVYNVGSEFPKGTMRDSFCWKYHYLVLRHKEQHGEQSRGDVEHAYKRMQKAFSQKVGDSIIIGYAAGMCISHDISRADAWIGFNAAWIEEMLRRRSESESEEQPGDRGFAPARVSRMPRSVFDEKWSTRKKEKSFTIKRGYVS